MKKINNIVLMGLLITSLAGCSFFQNGTDSTTSPVVQSSNPTSQNTSVQVARYSSIDALPTDIQVYPLSAISSFKFTPYVRTVGQAITQVLQGSGYALAPESDLPLDAVQVLAKPLPVTQRELGPITVQEAVQVLIGKDVFTVMVDQLHRTVSFQLNPAFESTPARGQ